MGDTHACKGVVAWRACQRRLRRQRGLLQRDDGGPAGAPGSRVARRHGGGEHGQRGEVVLGLEAWGVGHGCVREETPGKKSRGKATG